MNCTARDRHTSIKPGGPTFFVRRGELWGEFEHPGGIDVVPGVEVNINDCRFLGVVYRKIVDHPGHELRKTDTDEYARRVALWREEMERDDGRAVIYNGEFVDLIPVDP